MKKNYLRICLLCWNFLIFISTNLLAQKDFRHGFIITYSGDTIYGEINLQSNYQNSRTCEFRREGGNESDFFKPGDIRGYRVTENKFYISKRVTVDSVKQNLFLEFLVDGIVNLYFYGGQGNVKYFLEKDGVLTELSNEESKIDKDGTSYVVNTHKYKGLLRYMFRDSPGLKDRIENTSYDMKPLVRLTKEYHKIVCKDYQCIDYTKSTKSIIKIEPSVGYNFSRLSLANSKDHAFSSAMAYGIHFRFIPLRSFYRLNFITGVIYTSQHYLGNFTCDLYEPRIYHTYRIKMNYNNIIVPVTFEYSMPAKKIQPFVFLSYHNVFNVNRNSSIKIVNEPLYGRPTDLVYSVFRKLYGGAIGGLGLRYKIKEGYLQISAHAGYWFNMINTRYVLDYTRINPGFISIGYQVQL